MKNKSAILFDLDGTLLDTAPDLVSSINELLKRYEQPEISMESVRHLLTHGSRYFISNFFKTNATPQEIEKLRLEFMDIYSKNAHQNTKIFPGMLEVLETVNAKNIPWGIVTNKLTIHTLENLAALNLSFQPKAIVCGDTLPVAKPNPEPLWYACELLKIKTTDVIYIGDSEVDAEAGNRAGVDTLIVSHGYHSGESSFATLKIAGFIRDPSEIFRWVV